MRINETEQSHSPLPFVTSHPYWVTPLIVNNIPAIAVDDVQSTPSTFSPPRLLRPGFSTLVPENLIHHSSCHPYTSPSQPIVPRSTGPEDMLSQDSVIYIVSRFFECCFSETQPIPYRSRFQIQLWPRLPFICVPHRRSKSRGAIPRPRQDILRSTISK
ncbi:hypothetical protein BDZ97DRAFT_1427073 [Flammula alnicola]|nr:hypothetical protein BDZ97DRAFT_1427073 [Flammula alnicola]